MLTSMVMIWSAGVWSWLEIIIIFMIILATIPVVTRHYSWVRDLLLLVASYTWWSKVNGGGVVGGLKMVKQMASKRRGGQPLWSLTIGQPDHKILVFLRVPLTCFLDILYICKWMRSSSQGKETFLDKAPFLIVVCIGLTCILQNSKITDPRNRLMCWY